MNKNSNDIIVYGSGGLGRGVVDLIKSINKSSKDSWFIQGFIDDEDKGAANGYEILGDVDYLINYSKPINVVLAFGNPTIKRKLFDRLKENEHIVFPNIIHPNVDVSPYNNIGIGNIISFGVALSTNLQINNFNLIHYNCSIGHDVSMGSFNSVFPLAALSGYVELGDGVEVGTNAAVIPGKKIGDETKIGAGSVVVNDVQEGKTIVGVPGKEL